MYGDTVMSKKWERIKDEIINKYWLLNWNLSIKVKLNKDKRNVKLIIIKQPLLFYFFYIYSFKE